MPVTVVTNNQLVNVWTLLLKYKEGIILLTKTLLSEQFIELLKKSLLNELYIENEAKIIYMITQLLNNNNLACSELFNISKDHLCLLDSLERTKSVGSAILLPKQNGDGTFSWETMRNYTELSHTMIGRKRLDNIQYCIETVINDNVPGDFIETGVWRGGATIFMRGILAAYEITDRYIWVADSFEGLPVPTYPEDIGFDISPTVFPFLSVGLDQVMELFERYGLLDDQVNFIKGWFRDTLKSAPIEKLAVLRLDGDLYESTMDALNPLYDKVANGGFVIVDDYYSCLPCRKAVDEFRTNYSIKDTLLQIDAQSVFWRKQ